MSEEKALDVKDETPLWKIGNMYTDLLQERSVETFDTWNAFVAKYYGEHCDNAGLSNPTLLDNDDSHDWSLLSWCWVPSLSKAKREKFEPVTAEFDASDPTEDDYAHGCKAEPHKDKRTHLVYTDHDYLLVQIVNNGIHEVDRFSHKIFKVTVAAADEPAVRKYLCNFISCMLDNLNSDKINL
jgi:hypothetical protein